jgi:hypothetical protein
VRDATVLISSFDGYSDCWGAVAHGLTKYWPDCPYSIRLVTEEMAFPHPRIQALPVGRDVIWSNRMLRALSSIETPFIVYFQEDYWLNEPVRTDRVLEYVDLMKTRGLDYLRLLANPVPDLDFPGDARLGVLADAAEYRTSSQIALWRRQVLVDLLVPGESVWQFERAGTDRSRKYGRTFLSVKSLDGDDYANGMRYVCTAINSGKWARMAHEYAKAEGLAVDFSRRPTETWWDEFKRSGPLGHLARNWAHRLLLLVRDPRLFWQKTRRRLGADRT